MSASIRVVIADDHPLMRSALKEAIAANLPQADIAEASSLVALVDKLRAESEVDLVLLDLRMPDSQGFSALVRIRTEFPEVPVVVVSAADDRETIHRAIVLGASGYITKASPLDVVARSILDVLDGKLIAPTPIAPANVFHEDDLNQFRKLRSLTPQQFSVLLLIAEGHSNKVAASRLQITEGTIKAHITAILTKLGLQSRTQAAVLAQRALQVQAIEMREESS